jgi:hypothetical protein
MLRSLTDKQLKAFAVMARTDAGREFVSALNEELNRVMGAMVSTRGIEDISRLQGSAHCLQEILKAADQSEQLLTAKGKTTLG